jgi:hypothetical protein
MRWLLDYNLLTVLLGVVVDDGALVLEQSVELSGFVTDQLPDVVMITS